ncbi:MAG: type II toxin-antitoxin system VapC family toxin [Gammaproteobacteria bacterium]|nr:MAG: type II toxin-antitoxin system VapC family toxin [Gammaproteobacteria bacterium]
MPIPLVVPDASVLLKWVLPPDDEPDADKALLLRTAIVDDAVRALLPALWLYEVGNTIARRFPTHALDWPSALMKFGLEEAPASHPWLAKTGELTRRFDVSFYDAAYHAVALLHNGLFVAADTRYVNQVSEPGSVMALSRRPLDHRVLVGRKRHCEKRGCVRVFRMAGIAHARRSR